MKSSAAIADRVSLGLSRRKNGGRVAVAKSAPLPKVDIDELQYLFFFADPRVAPCKPVKKPRTSHSWGNSKRIHEFDHLRIVEKFPKTKSLFSGHSEVCSYCSAKRYQVLCSEPDGRMIRPVFFESSKGITRTRPPCAGFLK